MYNVNLPDRKIKAFDLGLFEDFFQAFVTQGGLNLHINLLYGRNPHHIMEAIFKATAKALDQATMLEERLAGKVLSTKGHVIRRRKSCLCISPCIPDRQGDGITPCSGSWRYLRRPCHLIIAEQCAPVWAGSFGNLSFCLSADCGYG